MALILSHKFFDVKNNLIDFRICEQLIKKSTKLVGDLNVVCMNYERPIRMIRIFYSGTTQQDNNGLYDA